jgi:2-methylcitrate dehydratase
VFEEPARPPGRPLDMADRILSLLSGYATSLSFEDVPPDTVHEVERRILDAIGVAVAGSDEPAAIAARAVAAQEPLSAGALVWGTHDRSSAETAGFANATAVRCLDFNDAYLSREPLHPSDAIAPLLALAETERRSGADLVAAIAVAYEVSVRWCDAGSPRAHGWDHVNHLAIGIACGASRLLGLDDERTRHALALTVVPHAAMRQTRVGELSMWKGVAAAEAGRNALFAARLATAGMTGPGEPFEGQMAYVRQVLGGEVDLGALSGLGRREPPSAILGTHIKRWPVEYHAQSAVDAALEVRDELRAPAADRIVSIHVHTFDAGYRIIAEDREKWDPRTRETADHSLPYIVTVALLDGDVTVRTFDEKRFRDPATLALLNDAVAVDEDAELTRRYPEGIPNRVTVHTSDGAGASREVEHPLGHARRPMTDEDVAAKFRANVANAWPPERADRTAELVRALPLAPTVDPLVESLEPST